VVFSAGMDSTADGGDDFLREHAQSKPVPGLVVIVQAGRPSAAALALPKQGAELGRGTPQNLLADDDQVSRGHVRVSVADAVWTIEDLGSRNGTFVDGVRLTGSVARAAPALLRLGKSLVWLVDDVRPFLGQHHVAQTDGPVLGGLSRRALGEITIASKAGDTLLILGESGAGKELLAHAFHEAHFGPGSKAPLVAVNCAAIPEGLAERLLFGAKRGAYSGATDADGYIQEAHGGTLFLDEVAELDLLVQAKLLRVFETREVLPVGAVTPRKVQIRICAATHKDLRLAANSGEFRADLYYRIGRPEVRIAPLRERLDEIPWLFQRVLTSADDKHKLTASVALIEACALRRWPGNVRELLHEARRAAHAALQEGTDSVRPDHLAPEAGLELGHGRSSAPATRSAAVLEDSAITSALEQNAGNVTRAAKALGVHRNQLRRWLAKRSGSGHPSDET
jgi:transcriptional regulator of acetoin/glycerol metabolism